MRILIVEDDFGSRRLLQALLEPYGTCDIVVDGEEALEAFTLACEEEREYDVIFLDIMMPRLDGQEALKRIRAFEKERRVNPLNEVKVVMITALEDPRNVVEAYYRGGATSYVVKPISRKKITEEMDNLGFIRT